MGGTYELDPGDGRVRSTISGVNTGGLAIDGDTLWYASNDSSRRKLVQIDRAGSVLPEVPVNAVAMTDLTIVGAYAYYISNSQTDAIVEVTLSTGQERTVVAAVRSHAAYSLGYDGSTLVVADRDGRGYFVSRIEPQTGWGVGEIRMLIPGLITAIAFDPGFTWELGAP
jgi:hypothetical protein